MMNKIAPSVDHPPVPMNKVPVQPQLLERMRALQEKADTIGPVDPDFNFKDYSNTL